MSDRTLREYAGILRDDFTGFVQRTFRKVKPADEFLFNWHIEAIAAKLDAVRRGEIKRLIINVPPRQGKSIIGSVAFPAFVLGHKPTAEVLCVSYGQDLADDLAYSRRTLMTSAFYKAVFKTRLSDTRQAIDDFRTAAGGSRRSTSLMGGITGRGADFIIIDDPMKADEALSDARRATANASFYNTIYSRLNNKETGAIVIIMQRLHADDLVAHVTEREKWDTVALPAISVKDESYDIPTPFGLRHVERSIDEALHPERESLAKVNELRAWMPEHVFSAQYQQDPLPAQGLVVKYEWLRFYGPEELPIGGTILQSWDTANKDAETNDFSVCTTWRYYERHFYLLDVFRERLKFPALVEMVKTLSEKHKAHVVVIEDKVSGTPLIQELRYQGVPVQEAPSSNDSKLTRLIHQTAKFASGFVHFPRHSANQNWVDLYVSELTSFPNGKFDDQVDSTVHALAWESDILNSSFHKAMEWTKLETERDMDKTTGGPLRPARLQILRQGHHRLPTREISVSEGEIIDVTEEEAVAFLRRGHAIRIN